MRKQYGLDVDEDVQDVDESAEEWLSSSEDAESLPKSRRRHYPQVRRKFRAHKAATMAQYLESDAEADEDGEDDEDNHQGSDDDDKDGNHDHDDETQEHRVNSLTIDVFSAEFERLPLEVQVC